MNVDLDGLKDVPVAESLALEGAPPGSAPNSAKAADAEASASLEGREA
jgi:hypothetical protein